MCCPAEGGCLGQAQAVQLQLLLLEPCDLPLPAAACAPLHPGLSGSLAQSLRTVSRCQVLHAWGCLVDALPA